VQRDGNNTIFPIGGLNPYQNRWSIKGRVMAKNMRTYANARGEGKLFNVELQDHSGGIRITGFNEVCDSYYDKITIGSCYIISGGTLKQTNAQYNKSGHPFEITLNRNATVDPCADEQSIPKQTYNFTTFDRIESVADDSQIDVLAIISSSEEPMVYTNKKGKEVTKRVMVFVDSSQKSIECTFFGSESVDTRLTPGACIAVKGLKVGSWNTKSLTMFSGTTYDMNLDHPAAHSLVGWWTSGGCSAAAQMISVAGSGGGGGGGNARRICFEDIENQALGLNNTPDFFSVACTITHIKTDKRSMWYLACPHCRKKVPSADEQALDGHCETCNKQVTAQRRWIFSALCNDRTGSRYINFFDDQAIKLIERTADEMAPLKEDGASSAFDRHFMDKSFQRVMMKCSVKSDTYREETRLKVNCSSVAPLSFVDESRQMLEEIKQMR